MGRCGIVVSDLMSWSRLRGIVTAAGHEAVQVRKLEALDALGEAAVIVVDLGDPAGGVAAVRHARTTHPDARIIVLGPHVRTDLMEEARAAGADEALPNSAVAGRLGTLLSS